MCGEVKTLGSPSLVVVTGEHSQLRFSGRTVGRSDTDAVQVGSKTVVIVDLQDQGFRIERIVKGEFLP